MNAVYRIHAIKRMFERDISQADVEKVIKFGEVINKYPNDRPYSSYLVLGYIEKRAIHVVYAIDEQNIFIIITVYEPSLDIWEDDFKERRSIK